MTDTLHHLGQRVVREAEDLARWAGELERRATFWLDVHDGHPTATMSDGTPRGSSDLTAVERAAQARLAITAGHDNTDVFGGLDQLRDDYLALLDQLGSMRTIRDRLIRVLPPIDRPKPVIPRCAGDPLCEHHIHARGLCATHYQQARRAAIAAGDDWTEATTTERPDDSLTRL